jgi:microcystin-dependent protein
MNKGALDGLTLESFFPAGIVWHFAGPASNVPPGFLLCDGSAVSRAQYPELFKAIGVFHGAGNGTTTFNLPNLTDKVAIGNGVVGAAAGDAHTHGVGSYATSAHSAHADNGGLANHGHAGHGAHSDHGHTDNGNPRLVHNSENLTSLSTGSTEPPNHSHNYTHGNIAVVGTGGVNAGIAHSHTVGHSHGVGTYEVWDHASHDNHGHDNGGWISDHGHSGHGGHGDHSSHTVSGTSAAMSASGVRLNYIIKT